MTSAAENQRLSESERTVNEPYEGGLKSLLLFHGRIRRSLKLLDQLASWFPNDVQPFRARALYQFFTGPLLDHDADEEEVLAAAIRTARHPRHLEDDIQKCSHQHRQMEELIDAILPHLKAVGHGEEEPNPVLLTTAAVELRGLLEPHLAFEEQVVFPMARALLTPEELRAVNESLAARAARRRPAHAPDEHPDW